MAVWDFLRIHALNGITTVFEVTLVSLIIVVVVLIIIFSYLFIINLYRAIVNIWASYIEVWGLNLYLMVIGLLFIISFIPIKLHHRLRALND